MINWSKLQNGTDIRGIAIEFPGKDVNITPYTVQHIANGFVQWLKAKYSQVKDLKIAVGADPRLSGELLKDSIIKALSDSGCTVFDCGLSTTPAMFMTTVLETYKTNGAIMITASHLPYYYNGMKFFTPEGGLEKEDITALLDIASKETLNNAVKKGSIEKKQLLEDYSKLLIDIIKTPVSSSNEINEKPLSGFKIIVDAGNGSGGFYAHRILEELGADIDGSQFTEPDGNFPNHIPNPEDKTAMESISKAVLNSKADLGIIFDADVDRAAIVDSQGVEINRNLLIALISAIVLEEHPGTTIVTDSVTSTGLSDFITELKGTHHRFKRGYKNVINEALRLNSVGTDSHLAIETSGHAALKENYFLDDGAYLVSKILIKMAELKKQNEDLFQLIKSLKQPKESTDFRIKINVADFKLPGEKVIEDLKVFCSTIEDWIPCEVNYEGLRVNCGSNSGNGWFLLRLSLHEPLLVLNVESDEDGGIEKIMNQLIKFFAGFTFLDQSVFS